MFLVGAIFVIVATAAVVAVLIRGTFGDRPSVPLWQVLAGWVIAGAALVFEGFAAVALIQANRRLRAWENPLAVLSRAQRKHLRAEIRGGAPVDATRVPVARVLAEHMLAARTSVVCQAGLGILWAGLWIARPTTWRAVIVCCFAAMTAVSWPIAHLNGRPAERFLHQHPAPTE